MTNEEQYLKYAQEYLRELRNKNQDFVIDGNTNRVGNLDLASLMDVDFGQNLEDELVCIHATDYSPAKSNAIESTESTGRILTNVIGESFSSHRITVHTTLNCLVKNNNGGNWDYRTFTILEPFSTIDSNICGLGVSDTFFEDKINLSDKGVILVREEDKTKLSEEDKKLNIVYYKGDPRTAANKAMIMMGYKPQTLEVDTIKNKSNDERIKEYRKEKGIGPSLHNYTIYMMIERSMIFRDLKISSLRNVPTNTCLDNRVSIQEVSELLKSGRRGLGITSPTIETIEMLLSFGIAFNESGPYFLNTHETIERIKTYYNQETFQSVIDDNNLSQYPEAVELLNNYNRFMDLHAKKEQEEKEFNDSYEEAQKTNQLLNSLTSEVPIQSFSTDSYLRQFVTNLNKLLKGSPFIAKIINKGIILYSASDEITFSSLFPNYSPDESLLSVDLDNIVIPFDFNKRLIDNLKDSFGSFKEVCQVLIENNYLKEPTPEIKQSSPHM